MSTVSALSVFSQIVVNLHSGSSADLHFLEYENKSCVRLIKLPEHVAATYVKLFLIKSCKVTATITVGNV